MSSINIYFKFIPAQINTWYNYSIVFLNATEKTKQNKSFNLNKPHRPKFEILIIFVKFY